MADSQLTDAENEVRQHCDEQSGADKYRSHQLVLIRHVSQKAKRKTLRRPTKVSRVSLSDECDALVGAFSKIRVCVDGFAHLLVHPITVAKHGNTDAGVR